MTTAILIAALLAIGGLGFYLRAQLKDARRERDRLREAAKADVRAPASIDKAIAVLVAIRKKTGECAFFTFRSLPSGEGDWQASQYSPVQRQGERCADPLAATLSLAGPTPALLTDAEIKAALENA